MPRYACTNVAIVINAGGTGDFPAPVSRYIVASSS
jgi:hypothetical protein